MSAILGIYFMAGMPSENCSKTEGNIYDFMLNVKHKLNAAGNHKIMQPLQKKLLSYMK